MIKHSQCVRSKLSIAGLNWKNDESNLLSGIGAHQSLFAGS